MKNTDIKKVFGRNLKMYRKKAGFTQEELAEKLSISPKHLSIIETGVNFVSASLLENIMSVLNVSASTLFYNNDEVLKNDNFLDEVEAIINKEFSFALQNIKNKLRDA